MTGGIYYQTIQRTYSGARYAVRFDTTGNCIAVAGPLDESDLQDLESINACFDRQPPATW